MTTFLELVEVHAGYGPVEVLQGIDLTVAEGEVVVVLGANGAGKTTMMRAVSGTIARALMSRPRLLLCDEPSLGLAPIIVQELLQAIRRITRDEGMSAIIVEQHPQAILAISDTAAVLDHGTVVHQDTAAKLKDQPELLARLLGVAR